MLNIRLSLLSCLLLPFYSHANNVHIQNHPIDTLVQKYQQQTRISSKVQTALKNTPKKAAQQRMRIMHIDLDYVYDANQKQQAVNIAALIQRIQVIQPTTIFLQAFADPDANGSADQVYFPNRHIAMRANLFQPVLQQIRSKTQVQAVYAWLPLMAWEFPKDKALHYVKHSQAATEGYIRLSPFDAKNLHYTTEIFLDFIEKQHVDGILYHDDITLNDFEDASSAALKHYRHWGFEGKQLTQQADHPQQLKFSRYKTAYLDQYAQGLSDILKLQQPHLRFARNMYAQVALQPKSEQWFAQSMRSTYQHYDYNALMAMPYMEKAKDHRQFYLDLIRQAKKYDPKLKRTIFELQAVDWNTGEKIANQEIANTIQLLEAHGVQHIGFYPDDFVKAHPDAEMLKKSFATP